MITKVILVRPGSRGKVEFPHGLLYLATALKQAGFESEIIDFQADKNLNTNHIISSLKKNQNAMLGISALAGSYLWVKKLCQQVKQELPQTKIIIGGHITATYEILIQKTKTDYVCLGEGEESLPLLIKALNQNNNLDDIPGIAYNKNNKIITTKRKLIKNFLVPDFSLINVDNYFFHPSTDRFFARDPRYHARSKPGDKMTTLMFSRGCRGACNFCYRHLPGYRQGEIDWAWEYMMQLYQKYNIRYFRIDDELFISDKKWFEKFYQKIIDSNIKIMFRVSGLRVDNVDNDSLSKLKHIGCIAINYGIESGSQKILDNMNKLVTVEDNFHAIQSTVKHGMQVMAYIMFGYPGETRKTLIETLNLMIKTDVNTEDVDIFYTVPLPGTRLYRDCILTKKIKDEEQFLIQLSSNIDYQYDRYTIKLGGLNRDQLKAFEKKFLFLIGFSRLIGNKNLIFKLFKKIILYIPDNSKFNTIFIPLKKITLKLNKLIHKPKFYKYAIS